MPHNICAFLGKEAMIQGMAGDLKRKPINLTQGLSMMYLTEGLFDKLLKSHKKRADDALVFDNSDKFAYLASHIICVLREYSVKGKIAYFETCYHGGMGWQSAVLFENGKPKLAVYTMDGEGIHEEDVEDKNLPLDEFAINRILKEFGIKNLEEMDAFDSVGLANFRSMPEE